MELWKLTYTGAAIPFGRSLTYRFAFAGFWSAVAFAEIDLPSPLNDWGVVKGLLLRHFRWWSDKHDIFNVDGCLNIGFAYQNYYMCEDYNSPQSVYWALKSFLAIGLPEDHPFWTAKEKPLPDDSAVATSVDPPMHIVCNPTNHHFLLSAGQFCPWPLKATEAKYCKFAYSSHFGFSVPTGTLIQQLAPDSTIAVSKDGGDTWRVPWKTRTGESRVGAQLRNGIKIVEQIPTLQSVWKPWKDADVEIKTILVAPCSRWPDWYMRITSISNVGKTTVALNAVEGGFAIQGRGSVKGDLLPELAADAIAIRNTGLSFAEGTLETSDGALICSSAGTSGIKSVDLRNFTDDKIVPENWTSTGQITKPDANTNLIWQRTLIPTIQSESATLNPGDEARFVSAVFAAARKSDSTSLYDKLDLQSLWDDVPILRVGEVTSAEFDVNGDYIDVGIAL
jgi:hypothetical protein